MHRHLAEGFDATDASSIPLHVTQPRGPRVGVARPDRRPGVAVRPRADSPDHRLDGNRRAAGDAAGLITEVVGGITIAALVGKVRHDQRALEALARADRLTGLFNRRAFEAALEVECARARRSRSPLSVASLDIDHFKRINDQAGHAAGDQVLRQLALAIGEAIRAHVDGGFRLGGDELLCSCRRARKRRPRSS